jgi:hypothetical protein
MNKETYRKILFWILPIAGIAFGLWYLSTATCDVIYSDYIRLVDSYLPDIYNPKKFFVPDVLTRIPVNYLGRIINVELFGFSVTFDRVLGVVFLGLEGMVLGIYFKDRNISCFWYAMIMLMMFSLNKWEMLVNGSGWCHFLAFAGFYYHEIILDRLWSGKEKPHDRIRLVLLPWLIILGTAGPYCASYAVVLILSYGYCMVRTMLEPGRRKKQPYLLYIGSTLVPLILYMISSTYVVEEFAGDTGRPLLTILLDKPTFPIRFLLKSFAGIFIGGEELGTLMELGKLSNKGCYALGMFVILGYLLALWLNLRYRLYEKTILPMMLLVGGGFNHLLVFMARYIFEKESYALNSSRYALQFQVGIFGIILTCALMMEYQGVRARIYQTAAALFCVAILMGNAYTTYHEMNKAHYRKEFYELRAERALTIPYLTDEEFEEQAEELADYYEYWNGTERLRNAFKTLEENHWNVFRDNGR